jgi:hypothetical protein
MTEFTQSVARILIVAFGSLTCLVLGSAWLLRQPNTGSVPAPAGPRAESSILQRHVEYLASAGNPRNPRHPRAIERAAAYIAVRFAETGASVVEQPYSATGLSAKNVIARYGPVSGERIVVGAHYDVFGELPGADDNASGVAGLLELARLLPSYNLGGPVELVAFSTEEPPYFGGPEMGSAVHSASLRASGATVHAMICLEMIGFFCERQPRQALLLDVIYPRRGDFVSVVGRWSDRRLVRHVKRCFRGTAAGPVVSYSGPMVLGSDLSDHRNYWLAGYPAVMITDTAYLRNFNYHTSRDLPQSLDYERMAAVVDGVLNTILHVADIRQ